MTIEATVHCSEEGCESSFLVELPLEALQKCIPVLPDVPAGWALEHRMLTLTGRAPRRDTASVEEYFSAPQPQLSVFCPDHRTTVALDEPEEADEDKEEPSTEILERARRLQALAMDKGASDNERSNAWEQFGKLWKKYRLPPELGL